MIEQSIPIQSTHPSPTTPNPIMLATNMANLFASFRPTVNQLSLNDVSTNSLFQSMKTENKQPLCQSLPQQWESLSVDANPILPTTTATTNIAQPSPPPILNGSILCNGSSTSLVRSPQCDTAVQNGRRHSDSSISTNFATTAAITSALSSNSSLVGPRLLPTCTPLLQLAVRQALNECLPNVGNLSIQGSLEVSLNQAETQNSSPRESIQSTAIIQFSDHPKTCSPPLETPAIESLNFAQECRRDSINSVNSMSTKQDHQSIFGNSEQNLTPNSTSSNVGSARRKSINPIRLKPDDCPKMEFPAQTVFPSMHPISPPLLAGHTSGLTSPSTDSGVLDLSRNGSLAGSAPITPMKDTTLINDGLKSSDHDQLLQACQKQLSMLGQLQFVLNRSSYQPTNPVDYNNMFYNPVNLTPYSTVFPSRSTPNSPSKPVGVRKQRVVNRISTLGRMCPIRRPNSSRRFHCNQCRQEFNSLHTLEEHTTSQHGSYRCHICNAQFTQRSNLQRHALKHVGFKPFECRVCSKAYYRKDHLMRHMEMGHPGYIPRDNITVHLTSSESLEFLNRTCPDQFIPTSSSSETHANVNQMSEQPNTNDEYGMKTLIDQQPSLMNVETNFPMDDFSIENDMNQPTSNPSAGDSSPYHEDLIVDEVQSDRRDSDYSLNELAIGEGQQTVHMLQPEEPPRSPNMLCSPDA